MSELEHVNSAPRRSISRRNIKILLGLTIINTTLIVGVGMVAVAGLATPSDLINCNNSILLDGNGMAYSDFHQNKELAEQDVLARAEVELKLLSDKKVSMYRCPDMCPDKFSTRATMDIRNIRYDFSPPPGEEDASWSASGSFVWYANLSCS